MRIRDNALVSSPQGRRPARPLFADLAIGQARRLRKPRKGSAHRVSLSVLRLATQDLLLVASNRPGPAA